MAAKSYKPFDCNLLDNLGVPITSLVADSRMVRPGDTFLAYAGEKSDARRFIPQAIAAGANAVIWERHNFVWNPDWKLPGLPVTDLQAKAGLIANHVYGYPSQKLWLVGITGTNGKTSCSHWYAQAMTILQNKTAVMGTLGNGYPDRLEATINTTSDAILLQRKMAEFLQQDAKNIVMEVSSHGIVQGRINGAAFAVAVLTNLSRDHLDYHGNMDAYAAAKARLFFWPGLRYAVLNLDDVFGVELSRQLISKPTKVIGYGFRQSEVAGGSSDEFQVVRGSNLRMDIHGLAFDVEFEGDHGQLEIDLVGKFNASNLLAVLAAMLANGVRFSDAIQALQQVRPIPGRMEKLGGIDQPVVIIDYAHTPDALEKVLTALREIIHLSGRRPSSVTANAKLFCVFGCGGERDKGKRKLAGEVATRLADEVIITSDNPRGEDARVIIDDIVAGVIPGVNYYVEENRALAIYQAIYSARKGDVVLIAGKGHEMYQEVNGRKLPFSDSQIALQVLQDLANGAQVPA